MLYTIYIYNNVCIYIMFQKLLCYYLLKNGVIGTPSKTNKLISDWNKNTLINSTVNENGQYFSFNVYSRKHEIPSKSLLDTKNA